MSSYFRRVPNFDYVSRNADQRQISNYTPVKNFFRRGKLREDIFGNLSYFTKYQIVGNDRPDNVALEVYGDEDLDWVVLISNNILNIQSEWPLEQNMFDTFLLEKYDDYETKGLVIFQKEETMPKLIKSLVNGIQIQTHAIGDLANSITLDWYEEAFNSVKLENRLIENPRWRIEHAQNILPEDQIRYSDLDIIASMQPSHAIGDLHFAHKRLGEQRLDNAYTWRNLIDLGVTIAGGSDAPVEIGDPRIEFKAAVSRKDLDGFYKDYWNIEQSVSREEALYMFTKWASYSVFEEDIKGTIEVGKLADFTVFSKDLMTIPEEEIMSSEVVMTIVGGEIKFSK